MPSLYLKYKQLKRRKRINIIITTVCLIIACSGLTWTVNHFWRYISYEITNDAFVDQYIAPVNIRVAGYIQDVRFKEHQFVRKGDTLIILDNREYLIRQKEAMAALLDARGSREVLTSGIHTSQMKIAEEEANIAEAEAKLWQAEQDFRRYERLLKEESIPEQQYEQAKANYEAARARRDALVRQKDAAGSQYNEATKKQTNAESAILKAEAALDLANLNLSYTVVTAPCNGCLGRRSIEEGQLINAGQTLTTIIPDTRKWVVANYKETQISSLAVGQEVEVTVDAFAGKTFKGRITAISSATGSKYSMVPTDNSAGNFVKIQQRVPVRIELTDISDEDNARLAAGMMCVVKANL